MCIRHTGGLMSSDASYGALTVAEVLALGTLRSAQLKAGAGGLHRTVSWCHSVDIPQVTEWIKPGELLLTTGYSWPADDAGLNALFESFAELGIAGVALAVPGYLAAFPAAALAVAERDHLPLIEVPWSVPFSEINQDVNREIAFRQLSALERLDHIYRELTGAALSARSLDDIVSRLELLLERAATFVDGGLHRAGQGDTVRPTFSVLVGTADATYGSLHIELGPKPLDAVDHRALELAATVCALHMLRQNAFSEAEARVQASFVDALLHGRFGQVEGLQERARLLGYNQQGHHRVVLAALIGPEGSRWALSEPADVLKREQVARALRWTFAEHQQPIWLTFDLNHVIAITPELPAEPFDLLMRAVSAACQRFAADQPVAVGVGTAQQGPDGPPQSLREARLAVMSAQEAGLWRYEDRLVERILTSAHPEALAALEQQTLGVLAPWPQLQTTLLTWALQGFSVELAARELSLHRNAVRERLKRSAKLTGRNLEDPQFRLSLSLVAQLHKLSRR